MDYLHHHSYEEVDEDDVSEEYVDGVDSSGQELVRVVALTVSVRVGGRVTTTPH